MRVRTNSLQLIFLISFLLVIVGTSCTKKAADDSVKRLNNRQVELGQQKVQGIEEKKVEKKPFPITLDLPGRVAIPDKDFLVLTARVAGRIDSSSVAVGDRVHVGSVLAMLWSPDLATAADEYDIAKTQNNAELVHLSEEKLRSVGISIRDAVPGRISFPLRSTLEGVVLDKKLNIGSAVNPGDQIMTIGKSDSFQFQADVPPKDALQLKTGMKVTFDDAPELKATVDSVSSIADPTSRLVRVRCRFEQVKNMSLAQETFLKAKVTLKERDSLVTSSKALVVDETSQYIFIRTKDAPKTFDRVSVKVLSTSAGEMAFEPADEKLDLSQATVVTDGALLLNGVLEGDD